MNSGFVPVIRQPTLSSFWRSLLYFSIYRGFVALFFLGAVLIFGDAVSLGVQSPTLFRRIAITYLAVSAFFLLAQVRYRQHFDIQLTGQVIVDILALTLMMFASGGQKSGIAMLLLVVVSGAGLVGQGRMVLFYAALASVAVLLEESWWALVIDSTPADFFTAGITSLAFFAAAIAARLLARRVVSNELLAIDRGQQLDAQLKMSEQIIHDMEGGVLVVSAEGEIQMSNPQARFLLGLPFDGLSHTLPQTVRDRLNVWQVSHAETAETLFFHPTNRQLRFRYIPSSRMLDDALLYVEDLEKLNLHVQHQKLAALGRLAANMAHEIRNPLAAISHAAELLAEDRTDAFRYRLATIVYDNTLRLNRLVTEVLELGRRDQTSRELIDWNNFIDRLMEEIILHNASAATRIKITAPSQVRVWFDPGHLHRVLWNLLTNALRYGSEKKGAVQVSVKKMQSKFLQIDIADDGSGIDKALQAQIFEPFFTTHTAGTGLGLYIARELCEANRASLTLLPSDSGAHFSIMLEGSLCP